MVKEKQKFSRSGKILVPVKVSEKSGNFVSVIKEEGKA